MPSIKQNWFRLQVVEHDPYHRPTRHDKGGGHTQGQLKARFKADGAVQPRVCYLHETNGFGWDLHPLQQRRRSCLRGALGVGGDSRST